MTEQTAEEAVTVFVDDHLQDDNVSTCEHAHVWLSLSAAGLMS